MPRRSARLAAQAAAAACPLLQLSDDVLEVVGHQISDALRPAVAGALAACNHNLGRVMRAPLAKLQPRHAAARALAAKVGSSCEELSEETALHWHGKRLDATDMATLSMLFSTGALAKVRLLRLTANRFGPAGGSALLDGLNCGDAPRLMTLSLSDCGLADEGATALAAALSRGALPNLECLNIGGCQLGDAGMAALAVPLRRRPALKALYLHVNGIGDVGMAALVDKLGAKEFKQLQRLTLFSNRVGEVGIAALAAALEVASLPQLMHVEMYSNPAINAALHALADALWANDARRAAA